MNSWKGGKTIKDAKYTVGYELNCTAGYNSDEEAAEGVRMC